MATPDEGALDQRLPSRHRRRTCVCGAGAQPAATRDPRLAFPPTNGSGATLLEVDLATGFLHQVRVSLAHIGHPLLGDRRTAPRGVP